MEVKYSTEKPPVYERCAKQFNVTWDMGIIMTYGDTVYCKVPLSEDLKIHEATHVKQQLAMGKELWWERYFADSTFRLSQEVEAYKNQLNFIEKHYNREKKRELKKHIVKCMVTLYDKMVDKETAEKLLYDN